MNKIKHLGLIGLILMLGFLQNAFADNATGNLVASTVLSSVCYIKTDDFSFGDITNGLPTGSVFTSAALGITCTKGTSYIISLDTGSSGSYSQRTMLGTKTGNSDKIYYNIYTNTSFNKVVGDGTVGTTTVSDSSTGALAYKYIYAKPSSQNYTTPDNYKDTITIKLYY